MISIMTIGENLQRLRKQKRLSQTALAERSGVSQQLISQIENDINSTTKGLPALARALEVNVASIDPNYEEASSSTGVPVISWISAGDMASVETVENLLNAQRVWVDGLGPGDWIALIVDGDSMDRISPPGSTIVVNRADRRLVANACYVIADDEGKATYKRYRPSPARFEPVSTNPEHEPLFPQNDPFIVGRVRRTMLSM